MLTVGEDTPLEGKAATTAAGSAQPQPKTTPVALERRTFSEVQVIAYRLPMAA